MSQFWRILDNKLYNIKEVENLGFEESEGLRIPDEYLNNQKFIIMRTCHGIGDWGVISAMPRLLKEKYPNCRVYIPSEKLVFDLFQVNHQNSVNIFKNNPYIDGFVDKIEGEVFHDHYRIYHKNSPNIPLLEQMLEFWQFEEKEYKDSQPELYWSKEEQELGDAIIKEHCKGEFGCLLLSDRFGTQCGKFDKPTFERDTNNITKVLKENPLPYFYWSTKPLKETSFNFIDKVLDMRHIDLRIQLYIKSKAKLNISNQCGTNHLIVRYSECIESQRQFPIGSNLVKQIKYK
jgi:hypothetical protein